MLRGFVRLLRGLRACEGLWGGGEDRNCGHAGPGLRRHAPSACINFPPCLSLHCALQVSAAHGLATSLLETCIAFHTAVAHEVLKAVSSFSVWSLLGCSPSC